MVKQVLDKKEIPYDSIDIDTYSLEDKIKFKKWAKSHNKKTLPVIIIENDQVVDHIEFLKKMEE